MPYKILRFVQDVRFCNNTYIGEETIINCCSCDKSMSCYGCRYQVAKLFEQKLVCPDCVKKYPEMEKYGWM